MPHSFVLSEPHTHVHIHKTLIISLQRSSLVTLSIIPHKAQHTHTHTLKFQVLTPHFFFNNYSYLNTYLMIFLVCHHYFNSCSVKSEGLFGLVFTYITFFGGGEHTLVTICV